MPSSTPPRCTAVARWCSGPGQFANRSATRWARCPRPPGLLDWRWSRRRRGFLRCRTCGPALVLRCRVVDPGSGQTLLVSRRDQFVQRPHWPRCAVLGGWRGPSKASVSCWLAGYAFRWAGATDHPRRGAPLRRSCSTARSTAAACWARQSTPPVSTPCNSLAAHSGRTRWPRGTPPWVTVPRNQ